MKNSMFTFAAAAFFMMTSCTMSEDDIPTPINDQVVTEIFEVSQNPQSTNELEIVEDQNSAKGHQARVSGVSNANELEPVKKNNATARTDGEPREYRNFEEEEQLRHDDSPVAKDNHERGIFKGLNEEEATKYDDNRLGTESVKSKRSREKKDQFDQRDYEKERMKKKYYYHAIKDRN